MFSSPEQPGWFELLIVGLFLVAAVGAAVAFVVTPMVALFEAGNEEMQRYREQHGVSAVSADAEAGANIE